MARSARWWAIDAADQRWLYADRSHPGLVARWPCDCLCGGCFQRPLLAHLAGLVALVYRQGQHGWDFAKAQGIEAPPPHMGRLVYAPAWSPDGQQIVYHRYLGYQALVDLDLTEIAGS